MDLPDQIVVHADREKMLQAIRNLVENCWKYTPKNVVVTITCRPVINNARIEFVNSGPGIPAKDIPFIFERFFTTDPSRPRNAGGAGIGSSIVKQLIETHGGTVGASNSDDQTRIWFELPLNSWLFPCSHSLTNLYKAFLEHLHPFVIVLTR